MSDLVSRWSYEDSPIKIIDKDKPDNIKRFKIKVTNVIKELNEKTYTVGNTQYWARKGKYYSWTESGGRKEISNDEYYKALDGVVKDPSKRVKKDLPKVKPSDYAKMENEDLIQYAQQDDPMAQERLILNYQPLITKLSNKYFLHNDDYDELEQTAMIGVWDAIKTYDEEKGDLHRHITNTVDRKLKDLIRSNNTPQVQQDTYAKKLDAPIKSKDGGEDKTFGDTIGSKSASPEEEYIGNAGAEQLMNFMKTQLGDRERESILRFVNGMKIPDIAEELGVSYKTVENALMRARNKIRQYREEYIDESKEYRDKDDHELIEDFELEGNSYKSTWGRYYKNNDVISRDEYRRARKKFDAKHNQYKGKRDNRDVSLEGNPREREQIMIHEVEDYIKDSELPNMTVPDKIRFKSDHEENISDEDKRREVLMDDMYIDEYEADNFLNALHKYTEGTPMNSRDERFLGEALDNMPLFYDPEARLYRGMRLARHRESELIDLLRNYNVGDMIPLRGFTSFSSELNVAVDFANMESGSTDQVRVILVNTFNATGSSVNRYSEYVEWEVLYKPDAKFIIKNVDDLGDLMIVHVEEAIMTEDSEDDSNVIDLGLSGSQHIPEEG